MSSPSNSPAAAPKPSPPPHRHVDTARLRQLLRNPEFRQKLRFRHSLLGHVPPDLARDLINHVVYAPITPRWALEYYLVNPHDVRTTFEFIVLSVPAVRDARNALRDCHRLGSGRCQEAATLYHALYQDTWRSLSQKAIANDECLKFLKPAMECVAADRIDCTSYFQPFLNCATSTTSS